MERFRSFMEPWPLLFYRFDDTKAAINAANLIEEGTNHDLGNGWTARSERMHHDATKYHNHLFLRGNQVAVVNRDGTPSHKSDLTKVPSYIMDRLRAKDLLEGHLVELTETASTDFDVPSEIIEAMHGIVERAQRTQRLLRNIGHPRV